MIDYMFWIGVVLWSVMMIMWSYDSKTSWSGLFIFSVLIFSGGVTIMLFLMSFLYGVISAIDLVI